MVFRDDILVRKTVKPWEYVVYFCLYFATFFLQSRIPLLYQSLVAEFQAFLTLYLAYRFVFLGLGIGVLAHGAVIGYMMTHQRLLLSNEFFQAGVEWEVFTVLAAAIVALLSKKHLRQTQQLEKLAHTDGLTGVYNHRYFQTKLGWEIDEARQNSKSLGLIILDVDNFRSYNNLHGHERGDRVLKRTAEFLKSNIREGDILCRYGGDEFAIILPGADINNIQSIATKIKDGFRRLIRKRQNSGMESLTFSMGLSEFPDLAHTKEEMIAQSDTALYHAKNLGKDNIHLYQDILRTIREQISTDHQQLIGGFKALLGTISAKDKYTLGHSERVSSYAAMVGEAIHLSVEEIYTLQYAGLLHDIGKVDISQDVLNKIEKLTAEELMLIQKHPVYGATILEPLSEMDQLIEIVRHHHERYDGKGYPDGLAGNQISIGARILTVADSFDAMLSERPYSPARSVEEAFAELRRCSGSQFDPEIVRVFIALVSTKRMVAAAGE